MKRLDLQCSEHPNFIGGWQIDDPGLCEGIIEFFDNNPSLQKQGRTGAGHKANVKKTTDMSIEPKDLEKPTHAIFTTYMDRLYDCYSDYLAQWPFLADMMSDIDVGRFNVQKYEPGGHFGTVHTERASLSNLHRVLAFMTYLNDVEDGGMTTFSHYGIRVKPETGKTLIWPAEWTHAHAGEVVNSGNKFIITGWMHFPLKN